MTIVRCEREPDSLTPVSAMVAPAVAMTLPTIRHPGRVPARWNGPSAIYPSPAASIQIPKAVHPDISWTGRVANGADGIGCRRRGHAICHVSRPVSAAAGHHRGGCQKNPRENCRFGAHVYLLTALDGRDGAMGCDSEKSITLAPIHVLRNYGYYEIATTAKSQPQPAGCRLLAWPLDRRTRKHSPSCPSRSLGRIRSTCCNPAKPGAGPA